MILDMLREKHFNDTCITLVNSVYYTTFKHLDNTGRLSFRVQWHSGLLLSGEVNDPAKLMYKGKIVYRGFRPPNLAVGDMFFFHRLNMYTGNGPWGCADVT